LEAGIFESGEKYETIKGTPQGAGISPLLANVFLRYVLDLWVRQWRHRHARGRVTIVRYADDFVVGFEKETDARRMLANLKERVGKFGLMLHEDKTRLIEFGRFAAASRLKRGERRPETFAFLGFTHYCGRTRDGRFIVKQDARQPPGAQADGVAPGSAAADAQTAGRAASLVRPRSARPLRLVRDAAQLANSERVPQARAVHLVQLPSAAEPEEPASAMGPVR